MLLRFDKKNWKINFTDIKVSTVLSGQIAACLRVFLWSGNLRLSLDRMCVSPYMFDESLTVNLCILSQKTMFQAQAALLRMFSYMMFIWYFPILVCYLKVKFVAATEHFVSCRDFEPEDLIATMRCPITLENGADVFKFCHWIARWQNCYFKLNVGEVTWRAKVTSEFYLPLLTKYC